MQRPALEVTTNGGDAVEEVRRLGELTVVNPDEEDTVCAVVRDTDTQKEYIFRCNSVQDGAVLQKGQQVSYTLTESHKFPSQMRVARVRVEDPTAKRRGTVTQWDGKKKRGIITEDGVDRQAHKFGRSRWPEGDLEPQQGMAVEFVRQDHHGQKFASDIVLILQPSASEESAGSQTSSPTTSVGHSSISDSNGKACLVWDFDQVCKWTPAFVRTAFITMVDRLVSDGVIADRAQLKSTAYVSCFNLNLNDERVVVVHTLELLGVDVKLQSGQTAQQVDRQLERDAEEQATLPNVSTIVIISSDQGFSRLIQSLGQKGKQTVLFHGAPAGSSHEKTLCLYARQVYYMAELGVPVPEATSVGEERRVGRICDVKEDRKHLLYGYIEEDSGEEHFFHSDKAHGVPMRLGQFVTFSVVENARSRTNTEAVRIEATGAGGRALNRQRAHSQPRQTQPRPDARMVPPAFQEQPYGPRGRLGPNKAQHRAQSAQRPMSSELFGGNGIAAARSIRSIAAE